MTRAFVLTNHKGGVGKSTSATNIALGIAGLLRQVGAKNPRVLLIDTDSQNYFIVYNNLDDMVYFFTNEHYQTYLSKKKNLPDD